MTSFPKHPTTRAELLGRGVAANQIESMRRNGEFRTVFSGVYVGRGVDDSFQSRAAAAALVLVSNQIVCDRAAAYIHGVDAYGVRESHGLPFETCVLRGGARSRRQGIDGRERDLNVDEVLHFGRLRVTTPIRTALDLGCSLPRHRALGVMDELARRHDIDRGDLETGVRRFRGRRGVVQLRALVQQMDPRAESQRESWLRLEIADAGFPSPEVQWWVLEDGVPLWRLDLAYPAHKVAIEYDGVEFHRQTRAQTIHDEARRDWLYQHGWVVIVVTKENLFGVASQKWMTKLAESLRPQTQRFRWETDHKS